MRVLLHAPWPHEYATALGRGLKTLEAAPDVRLVVCRDYAYAAQSRCRIDAVYPQPRDESAKLTRGMRHLWGLCRVIGILLRWRPQVFHVQALRHPELDWPLLVVARLLGIAVVWTAHNSLPHEQRGHHRRLYRLIYRLAHAVIAHTQHTADRLRRQLGVPAGKMHIIAHGDLTLMAVAPPTRTQARRALELADSAFVLFFFGRIRAYKGLDVLLDALARLDDDSVVLLVAGEDVSGLCAGLRASANLRLDLRRVDDTTAATYFRAADLVVLPYRDIDQSGVLMLAMSYGCAVLATDVGGLGEVIEHGRTGFLVPPNDSQRLAEAIAGIRAHPGCLAPIRAATRRAIREDYGWDRLAARTLSLYTEVGRT